MSDDSVICPKCGHDNPGGGTECSSCGVIFARYERYLKKKQAEQEALQSGGNKSGGMGLFSLFGLVVLVTAGVTYYFTSQKTEVEQVTARQASLPAPEVATKQQVVEEPTRNQARPAVTQPVPGNAIERARKATVSIETPWGTGSGFFISDNFIVTNRHVLEVNQEQLVEFRRKVEAGRELIDLEKEKIAGLRDQLRQIPKGPTREQLKIIIAERERELARVLPQYEEAARRLERMQQDTGVEDIKVYMADGTEHIADYLQFSNNYDLALISISVAGQPYLASPPGNSAIRQGDKVFTIGSPVGLRNTVTAGIFSGYRKRGEDGTVYLQTDAPINPGNSGGPLIDEAGYVRGVNTMILLNTEGIGFAIPIEKVFEDFGSSLY